MPDDARTLTDALYEKYFGYALEAGQTGNLTYLMLGLVDVSFNPFFLFIKIHY